jgi:hypothetical protein
MATFSAQNIGRVNGDNGDSSTVSVTFTRAMSSVTRRGRRSNAAHRLGESTTVRAVAVSRPTLAVS